MQEKICSISIRNDESPEAYRRAGGRLRYNRERQRKAKARLGRVRTLLLQGLTQAEIARRLHTHRSTICRDMRKLRGPLAQTILEEQERHGGQTYRDMWAGAGKIEGP